MDRRTLAATLTHAEGLAEVYDRSQCPSTAADLDLATYEFTAVVRCSLPITHTGYHEGGAIVWGDDSALTG